MPPVPAGHTGDHLRERITGELLNYLRSSLAAGMQLPDPADPGLGTIRVVRPGH